MFSYSWYFFTLILVLVFVSPPSYLYPCICLYWPILHYLCFCRCFHVFVILILLNFYFGTCAFAFALMSSFHSTFFTRTALFVYTSSFSCICTPDTSLLVLLRLFFYFRALVSGLLVPFHSHLCIHRCVFVFLSSYFWYQFTFTLELAHCFVPHVFFSCRTFLLLILYFLICRRFMY